KNRIILFSELYRFRQADRAIQFLWFLLCKCVCDYQNAREPEQSFHRETSNSISPCFALRFESAASQPGQNSSVFLGPRQCCAREIFVFDDDVFLEMRRPRQIRQCRRRETLPA